MGGSGIRKKIIPDTDLGVIKASDPKSGSATPMVRKQVEMSCRQINRLIVNVNFVQLWVRLHSPLSQRPMRQFKILFVDQS
jgi:hypothetical protein